MSNATNFDWIKAKAHLEEVKERYTELISRPGVNPYLALGAIVSTLERYDEGERTQALYYKMLSFE